MLKYKQVNDREKGFGSFFLFRDVIEQFMLNSLFNYQNIEYNVIS